MYQNGCNCNGGLGDAASTLIPLAAAAFGGPAAGAAAGAIMSDGSGSGTGGSGMPGVAVSPQISTQISPQISPVFQQQFQPQNSGMTAGTAMTGAPVSAGGQPGMPAPYATTPGYAPTPSVPQVPQVQTDWTKIAPYLLGGIALVGAIKVFGKKRGA